MAGESSRAPACHAGGAVVRVSVSPELGTATLGIVDHARESLVPLGREWRSSESMTIPDPGGAAAKATRDVFISYRSTDDHQVRPVVEGLTDAGISCWFGPNDLGVFDDQLTQRIRTGIRNSRASLAFISNDYQSSNACKWEVIESISCGGVESLLHVAMPGADVHWAAVQETLFAVLPTTDHDIAELADKLAARLANVPLRNSSPPVADAWWETRWTGRSATGMFANRLALLGLFTEHLGAGGSDTGRPEVAQVVGFGGTGKSMLALQFARDFERLFDAGIVRINAGGDARGGDVDDRVDAMQDILRQVLQWIGHWESKNGALPLKVPRPQDADAWVKARSCVAEILRRSEDRGLLWIVDDLPGGLKAEEVQRLCCPSPGHTLITTRSDRYTAVIGTAGTMRLDGMERDDAVLLLNGGDTQRLREFSETLGHIADEVGCHALTLAVLAPMIEANGAPRTLQRIRRPHPQTATWLERAAAGGMELPNGHDRTILGTLSSSILGVTGAEARTMLRLGSVWPKGQQMGRTMLEVVIGEDIDHGCRELLDQRLVTTDADGSVTVHAMISTVAGWLVADGALAPGGDEPSERDLRLAAATFVGAALPEIKPADVWRESDDGQVVWHLLEPLASTLDDEHLGLSARALLAMARLPMRHKPAGLTRDERIEVLATAAGWADEAQSLYANMSGGSTDIDKAAAMRGLLRLDLAEILSGQEAIDECEAGTQQLREVVALRQEAARVHDTPESREYLAKGYFNLGRLINVAKKLEENGAQAGVPEALDEALTAYTAAARIREESIAGAGGEVRAKRADLEDVASSYRGMAIVGLTRVCRQDALTLARRRQLLDDALVHLAEARRLTCTALAKDSPTDASTASAEMGKDLVVVAHVQLCRWLLGSRDTGVGPAEGNPAEHAPHPEESSREAPLTTEGLQERWRKAERALADAVELTSATAVAGDSVPWPAVDSGEPTDPLASARLALARLTVNQARGGKHPSGAETLRQVQNDDLPALVRRRASGIIAS